MPEVRMTPILGGENIASSRLSIINNFEVLASAINNMQTYLDIDALELNGIQKLNVYKGDSNTPLANEYLINTNGSVAIKGNTDITGKVTSGTGKFLSGLELSSGNFTLSSSNSILSLNGDLVLGGELVLKDMELDGYIPSYSKAYFQNAASSGENLLITDPDTFATIGGIVYMKGRNSLVLDWSQYSSSNPSYALYQVLIQSSNLTNVLRIGQVVDIIVKVSDGTDFYLLGDTLICPEYASGAFDVKFDANYQSVRVVWDGTNWVILNLNGAVLVARA